MKYMQNNVYKVYTCDYVNMCATVVMLNADTICSKTNVSVHNESAIVQFSSAIYCLCVRQNSTGTEGIPNTSNKI
jgi:hypothetical protein